jgi:mycofactocin system glycosyltransferase
VPLSKIQRPLPRSSHAVPASYELDPTVDRFHGGRVLAGGLPSRLVRLTVAGVAALDRALAGAPLREAEASLVGRLERLGLLHPVPAEADPEWARPTTIVPVRDGGAGLLELVRALRSAGEVIVVDDRSTDGSPARAAQLGARVVPNRGMPGPAGARNAGLQVTDAELVAFVDADCVAAPDWHRGLGGMLSADPTLALLAPRIRAVSGGGRLERYERRFSPLDLGPEPSLVGRGRRVSYLPSTAFVARRADLLALGGFDERLRFGEDVDLVLRLLASGRRARYVPRREVFHRARPDLRGLAAQRAGYGSSAPELAGLHDDAIAPLRLDRHGAAVIAAALVAGPAGAAVALGVSVVATASQGSDARTRAALARISLHGHASTARHLSRTLVREWLPLSLAAAALGRRARAVAFGALAIDLVASARRGPGAATDPINETPLRLLDHAAYSTGLWRAVVGRRSLRAVLPVFGQRG